jgi:ubiquinone/menaquinone biosynthesis C-methylase UbiE
LINKYNNNDATYDPVKRYFEKDANCKKDFYKSKTFEQIKKDIKKRKMWRVYTKILDETIKNNAKISNVCDVGCGMGNFVFELINRNYFDTIVGIDFLRETLIIPLENKDLFKDACFIQGDLFKLPFKNNCFDFVFCLNVLHHIQKNKFKEALCELARVSNKYIVLEIRNSNYLFDFWYSKISVPYFYKDLPVYPYSIKTVCDILKECGFDLLSVKGEKANTSLCRCIVLVFKKN